MWTLTQAAELIKEIEPPIRELHYHTLLGGGVLHKGHSQKDLDIWFMPLNGYESNITPVYLLLQDIFGILRPLRDGPDYQSSGPYHVKEMLGGTYLGKRVDLFIL